MALAASSAAMAEVTLSGTIDAGIANTSVRQGSAIDGSGAAAGAAKIGTYFSGAGGFVAGNNIIFSGSEDIGGGLKGSFTLAMGFDAGNGSFGNGGSGAGFTQQANVGLSGDFGSIKAGMQLSPFIASVAGTGMLGNGHFFVNRLLSVGGSTAFLQNGGTAAPGASSGGFFVPNAISYTSPNVGGFTATVLTATKSGSEGSVVTDPAGTNRYTAASLTGAFGDLAVSLAYHTRSNVYKTTAISANYNLGSIKLTGNYMTNRIDDGVATMGGIKVNSYGIGAGMDVSEALNVAIQYARNDIDGGEQALTGLHAKYSLSKRTFAYASHTRGTNGAMSAYEARIYNTNVVYGGNTQSNATTAIGIGHSF